MKIIIDQVPCVEHGKCLTYASEHETIDPPKGRCSEEVWVNGDGGNPVRLLTHEFEVVDDD